MKFVPIFDSENQGLYSFIYDDQIDSEFDRLFDLWQDVEYLESFFSSNILDLQSGFYGSITVEEAVLQTIDEVKKFREEILKIYEEAKDSKYKSLNNLFIPLHQFERTGADLIKHKAYGLKDSSWIRLYALKLESNYFIITGGCIKLTDKMKDRPHTQDELTKLDACRDFLRKEGIADSQGLKE